MQTSPRRLAVAATAVALALGLSACAEPTERVDPAPAPAPVEDRADCDLGDIEEGDADCKDPIAYAQAVRKYGRTKVQKAERKHLDRVTTSARAEAEKKARQEVGKRIPTPTPNKSCSAKKFALKNRCPKR